MHSNENKEVPFVVESTNIQPITSVKISTDGKILVNGSKYGDYTYVSHLQKQRNGIYSFQSPKDDNVVSRIFVDPQHPEKKFPTVDIDTKNRHVSVSDFHWTSLNGKSFVDELFASVDPITESIVLKTISDGHEDESEIVVNNIPWKSKFYEILSAESYYDKTLVIARKRDTQNSLYINDKEWSWPVHNDPEVKKKEEIVNCTTNGKGVVAAVVSSTKSDKNKFYEHIFIGDEKGAKKEWKTKFDSIRHDNPLHVAVDSNSDNVSVVGMIKGIPTLVLNDIVCKLSSEPHNIEKFNIKDGVVLLQYKNALAKEFAEKISLLEDAHEVQSYREEMEDADEKIFMLREIMNKTGLNPGEMVEYLTKYATLGEELKKEREKTEKFFELKNDKAILDSQNSYLQSALKTEKEKNQELESMIDDFEDVLEDTETVLSEINNVLKKHAPTKAGWSSSKSKMSKDVYDELMAIIGGRVIDSEDAEGSHFEEKKEEVKAKPASQTKKDSKISGDWFK